MATARVTIIDQRTSDSRKRELAVRLSDALLPPADDLREPMQWVVVAESVRPDTQPSHGPDRRFANLDFATWHAHLAGTQRWVPNGN